MIKALAIRNFRGFENHEIPLRSLTVMVGSNNAGKSTAAEALRLVSLVVSRYKHLNFQDVPSWLEIARRYRGVSPSTRGMDLNIDTVFHRYSEPPGIVTAFFESGEKLTIYVGPKGSLHATIENADGKVISTKGQAQALDLPSVTILPQVAPLAREETVLTPEYVGQHLDTSLAPLHFRNQLNILYDHFKDFTELAEKTWSNLKIEGLDGKSILPGGPLNLFVREKDFAGEVALMGHGLQIWLQIVWFLTRARGSSTVILDEPDVYLHADLQRKLIRILDGQYPQVIVTTHSPEVMSEVDHDAILIINRRQKQSRFATSLPGVQDVIEKVGSVHNIHLAKLGYSRRLLLVEGKDLRLLKIFQLRLFPSTDTPIDSIPNMSIGGWGGWSFAIGSSMFMKNAVNQKIQPYCILDADYHTEAQKKARLEESKKHSLNLHIWKRKEIENYLLIPEVIQRAIKSETGKYSPNVKDVSQVIDSIVEDLKEEVIAGKTTAIQNEDKKIAAGTAYQRAKKEVDKHWENQEGKLSIVPGKQMLSKLSEWSQTKYAVSLSAAKIARTFTAKEIPQEVKEIVLAIETNKQFPIPE